MKIYLLILLALSFTTQSIEAVDSYNQNEVKTIYPHSIENRESIRSKFSSKGGITFASVGNGAECTFNTGSTRIQDAIDSGVDEVRIVHDHEYNENLIITERDLSLVGNYSSCSSANSGSRDSTHSVIKGVTGSGTAVIRIIPSEVKGKESPIVNLRYLDIENGTTGFLGWGGIHVKENTDLKLEIWNTNITNNTGYLGGGLALLGNNEVKIYYSSISSNNASYGGGIYCQNNNAKVTITGSSIFLNKANALSELDGKGGGIFAKDQCLISIFNHDVSGDIFLNRADNHGGGIYAENGATIYFGVIIDCILGLGSCTTTTVNMTGNHSDFDNDGNGNGGGAYISGAGTRLRISTANITYNQAGGHGGAIALHEGASLKIYRGENCWNQNKCIYFSNNKAGEQSYGAGGAIFNSSSTASIKHATFEDNRADFGAAIDGSGENSVTTISSSIFNHNGNGGGNTGANGFSDNYVIRVVADATLNLLSSTIADNDVTLGVLGIGASSAPLSSTIYSSIIHDPGSGNVFAPGSTGYISDCILAHETDSFINVGSSFTAPQPFIDSANRDYHIRSNSLAADACDNLVGASDEKDIDFEPRGYDDPNLLNILGPFDIGADETFESDIIFKHGFE